MIALHPFRHLAIKMLSIGLAFLIWLIVAGEPVVERGLRVPLEFQNIPAGVEPVGNPPSNVDIRVRGASGLLSHLQPGDVVAVLNLRGVRPGRRLFHVLTESIRAPFGVEVTQVQPATVVLTLESSGVRIVPVVPQIEGEPAPGHVVGRVTAAPATVEVVGPESRLRLASEAVTDVVSVADRSETVREEVTVGVPDAALRLRAPTKARITVTITPAPLERTIDGVVVRARNTTARVGAQVVPQVVSISVRGRREAVSRLTVGAISAYVDLAGLGSGRYSLPVQTEPLLDVGVTRIEPARVAVRIR